MIDTVIGTSGLLPDAPTIMETLEAGFSMHGSHYRLVADRLQHRYGITCSCSQSRRLIVHLSKLLSTGFSC